MTNNIKRLKNTNGFTIIEILAVVIILGILVTVGIVGVTKYIEKSKARTYESYKYDLSGAANNMMIDCLNSNGDACEIPAYGTSIKVTHQDLVNRGYSKPLKDPEADGYCDTSYVIVTNEGQSVIDLKYQVCLFCSKYQSKETGCNGSGPTPVNPTKITVFFYPDGGEVSPTSMVVTPNKRYGEDRDLPTPTKTGYDFVGWYTQGNGGEKITNDSIVSKESDHTLYAKWLPKQIEVEFDVNGAGGSVDKKSTKVRYHEEYGQLPIPNRKGYTFTGWYTQSSYGDEVISSTIVTNPENHKLYAHWKQKNITVMFDATGGSVSPGSKYVIYNEPYGSLPTPNRTGYTFAGWYTKSSGGEVVTSSTTVNNEYSHSLYAHWTANSYTIIYDKNNGSGSMSNTSCIYGQDCTLRTNTFTRSGYTFSSWNTRADGKGTSYNNGDKVRTLTSTNNGTVTLYAQWSSNDLTIELKENIPSGLTGSVTPSTITVTPGNKFGTLPIPTIIQADKNGKKLQDTGYTFAGWYTKSSGGTLIESSTIVVSSEIEINSSTGKPTLYAHWEPHDHNGSARQRYTHDDASTNEIRKKDSGWFEGKTSIEIENDHWCSSKFVTEPCIPAPYRTSDRLGVSIPMYYATCSYCGVIKGSKHCPVHAEKYSGDAIAGRPIAICDAVTKTYSSDATNCIGKNYPELGWTEVSK